MGVIRVQALEGIRVLDLTHALAGPFCTYHLQLLGANVIKIERPKVGDDFRDFARLPGWDVSPSFIAVNGGKRSVTVNLKDPDGQVVGPELAANCDVLVENLRPGAARELGLGRDDLREVNPRLVYSARSRVWLVRRDESAARGRPHHPGDGRYGAGVAADDDVPSQGRAFSVDCFTGYVAFAQILGALVRRGTSGQGQYLDVAMLDASLVLLGVGSVRQLITGDDVSAAQPIVHDRTDSGGLSHTRWLDLAECEFSASIRGVVPRDRRGRPARRWHVFPATRPHGAQCGIESRAARHLANCSADELEGQRMRGGCPTARVRTTRQVLQMPILRDREMLQPGVGARSRRAGERR